MEERSLFIVPSLLGGVGPINAAAKILAKQMGTDDPDEVWRRINSGRWVVSEVALKWREEDGIIYFSVTSDGTTGEGWINFVNKRLFVPGDSIKDVLQSSDFKPTSGVTTEIAVLKGMLFDQNDRVVRKIRAYAAERKLEAPNAEAAFLIRKMFTAKEIRTMGLSSIIVMHEPITDSDGYPLLLRADWHAGCWMNAVYGEPDRSWVHESAFAFAVPK